MVQTPGAKCGDRGQVKRTLRIGVTEGSGHAYPEKLERRSDIMAAVRHSDKGRTLAGQNSGYEISGWNEGFPSGWNERCHVSQGAICVSKEEGVTRHLFREDPTVGGCASSSGRFWAVA